MVFKLEYDPSPGNDIISLTVSFRAANWPAAELWATVLLKQIGATWTGATLVRMD